MDKLSSEKIYGIEKYYNTIDNFFFQCHHLAFVSLNDQFEKSVFDVFLKYMYSHFQKTSVVIENTSCIKSECEIKSRCFVLLISSPDVPTNVSSVLNNYHVHWDYYTEFMVICYANCMTNDFVSYLDKSKIADDLSNFIVLDLTSDISYRVCGSSKKMRIINITETSDIVSLRTRCKVDFQKQKIPVSIMYNPPLTIFKDNKIDEGYRAIKNVHDLVENYTGLEVSILKSLMKQYNFIADIKDSIGSAGDKYGRILDDGRATGNLFVLSMGKVNMDMTIRPVSFKNRNITMTYYTLYVERPCLVVDRSLFKTYLLDVFTIFNVVTRITVGSMAIVVLIVWIILLKHSRSPIACDIVVSLGMDVWHVMTNHGIMRYVLRHYTVRLDHLIIFLIIYMEKKMYN